jgi:hypothetical protein
MVFSTSLSNDATITTRMDNELRRICKYFFAAIKYLLPTGRQNKKKYESLTFTYLREK